MGGVAYTPLQAQALSQQSLCDACVEAHLLPVDPRGHRGCTYVSWNTQHPDIVSSNVEDFNYVTVFQLAVGLERSRNDSTVLVLDTSIPCDPTSTVLTERHRQISTPLKTIIDTPLQMESKIIFDTGVADTVCSLSWIPASLHIAVGMGSKTIKIYDINGMWLLRVIYLC